MCFKTTIIVDNIKAAAIYKKAIADLHVAWPIITKFAEDYDANTEKGYQEYMAKHDAREAQWLVYIAEANQRYEEERAAYIKERNSIWGTRRPAPEPPFFLPHFEIPRPKVSSKRIEKFDLMRESLVQKAYLAEMATEPFAMLADEVEEMRQWENGIKIAKILRMIETTRQQWADIKQ